MGRIRAAVGQSLHPSDHRLATFFGGRQTSAGVAMDERTAMGVPAAWACVRQYAEDVASLPKHVHERMERGRRERRDHPVFELIGTKPNPEMDAYTFFDVMETFAVAWGAATADVEWDRAGRPRALWPVPPWRVRPQRPDPKAAPVFEVALPDGGRRFLSQDRVLRVLYASFDGIHGVSPIQMHRETLGLSWAAQQYGSRFFSQDARPSYFLTHPETLSETAKTNLRSSVEQQTQGLSNAHRLAVLEEGVTPHQVSIAPDDAQWLESRKFQMREIAQIYNMPPHRIQDLENAHLANIEQESLNYVVYTLRRRLVRWEQAIDGALLSPRERRRLFSRIDPEGLLRGDIASRYEAYATARQWGWLSANDVRELEDMNPIDGGDTYLQPLNMIEVGAPAELPASNGSNGSQSREMIRASVLSVRSRSFDERRRLREQYREPIRRAVESLVDREAQQVRDAAAGAASVQQVSDALDRIYADGSEVREFARSRVGGQLKALVDEVVPVAEEEAGGRSRTASRQGEQQQAFAAGVVDVWTAGYMGESERRLRAAALDADGYPAAAVDAELQRWGDEPTRAGQEARRRSVEVADAAAVFGFSAAGASQMRWQTSGTSDCPYCSDMDGLTVSTGSLFVEQGGSVSPAGGLQPLSPSSDVGHPPLHDACDCSVTPA